MDLLSKNVNQLESRFDDSGLAFYHYTPVDDAIYSIGMKNLKEAVLIREMAELKLVRLLRNYPGKLHSVQ